jgi:hypothetical protein
MFNCSGGGVGGGGVGGGGATGAGAGGGLGRSSGGEKPRLGNPEASPMRAALRSANRGVAETVLVVSLDDQSPWEAGAAWVRASWKRRLSLSASAGTCPIRSGIAKSMKAANETEPSTNAAQGAQRHVSTWGSPFSRIRGKG